MLKQALKTYFGFDSFLKGQEAVINKVLERESSAAIFPTGAGKSLCYQLPAMLLPGMTLVVSPLLSLAMEKVIRPKFSYFEDYAFKFVSAPETILSRFEGERKAFVAAVMEQSRTKKIWTTVDIPATLDSYACDRQRIISALEYFDEKGWIELQARQAVDVYDILPQAFDVEALAGKMYALFKKRGGSGDPENPHHGGFFRK